jgi:hypothetical protein
MRFLLNVFLLAMCLLAAACSDGNNNSAQKVVLDVREDPLLRMPGTQPGEVTLGSSSPCYECHGGPLNSWINTGQNVRNRPNNNYDEYNIYTAWQGSMMGNSARDPLMFACFTVSAQDSIFAIGSPNAVDMCLRCHFPKGWLEGRSSTLNASAMTGEDYDGIQCSFCHRLVDPFYKTTFSGERESANWSVIWNEMNVFPDPLYQSFNRAKATAVADSLVALTFKRFSGAPFHVNDAPYSPDYTEAAGGQYFVSPTTEIRGPFADVDPGRYPGVNLHNTEYSRFHKGKFFCATCHDVSNPVMGNLPQKDVKPGDAAALTSESQSAFMWSHVERTYSEFRLSAYDAEGGAPGKGNFRPNTPKKTFPVNGWETDQPDNNISKCQDCHMCSRYSPGSNLPASPIRPEGSSEHPDTWMPCHAMTGANVWMTSILLSIAPDNPNPDSVNQSLLLHPETLTMDVMQGTWTGLKKQGVTSATPLTDTVIAYALNLAAGRIGGTVVGATANGVLQNAANITDKTNTPNKVVYDPLTGKLEFRIQNNTGHKMISGFPEGRRMYLNIKVFSGNTLTYEINPYDYTIGTLKGIPREESLSSPAIADGFKEKFSDELVYEAKLGSTLVDKDKVKPSFHFALANYRFKDNRIPPKGFDIANAAKRLCEPVIDGVVYGTAALGEDQRPGYFAKDEYAGGYDSVTVNLPFSAAITATRIEVNLYYQTTSREYIEFLRDEINGTGRLTLPASAYVVQKDSFFARLKVWGTTIFALWDHNKDKPGGAPFKMTGAVWSAP